MTSKQNIEDSPIDFAERIISDVKNSKDEGVLKCVQCGMCTSTCPAARHSDYNPRDIIERVLDGDESILEDDLIWNCFYCYTCHSVCPVGNSVCEVNQILKQIAISKEIGYPKLYEYMGFADSLGRKTCNLSKFRNEKLVIYRNYVAPNPCLLTYSTKVAMVFL